MVACHAGDSSTGVRLPDTNRSYMCMSLPPFLDEHKSCGLLVTCTVNFFWHRWKFVKLLPGGWSKQVNTIKHRITRCYSTGVMDFRNMFACHKWHLFNSKELHNYIIVRSQTVSINGQLSVGKQPVPLIKITCRANRRFLIPRVLFTYKNLLSWTVNPVYGLCHIYMIFPNTCVIIIRHW